MYMGDDYYQRQIDQFEKDKNIARMAMDICIEFIEFKNKNTEIKVKERMQRLRQAELGDISPIRKKFNTELDKVKQTKRVLSFEVVDMIEQRQERYRLKLKYDQIDEIAEMIAENPVSALKHFTSDFIVAKREIENILQEKENDKLEDKKAREEEEYTYPEFQPTYTTSSYRRKKYEEPKPFTGATDEESKELVEARIDERIGKPYGSRFTYEEEKRLRELYPELDHRGYYSLDTLDSGIEISRLSNKGDLKLMDIMELGMLTLEVVKKELTNPTFTITPELYKKIGIEDSFEKYKAAYEKFKAYYKTLSPTQQDSLKDQLMNNESYTQTFGEEVITPDGLKAVINGSVIRYIEKHYKEFYGYNNTTDFFMKTHKAVKYMDVDDIVSLYRGIKYEATRFGISTEKPEERRREEAARKEFLEHLQRDFASLIIGKLGAMGEAKRNATYEEELAELEEEEKKIVGVIKDILKEEPLDSRLRKLDREFTLDGVGDSLVETSEIKKRAKIRINGLPKVKLRFAKMTYDWDRFMMLMEKPILSEREQKELDGMFARRK